LFTGEAKKNTEKGKGMNDPGDIVHIFRMLELRRADSGRRAKITKGHYKIMAFCL
jgi:hypothetical protein